MRLLLVSHCPNDPNGGASRVYHFLTDGFRARGHEVECLHLEDIRIPRALRKFAYRCAMPGFVSHTAAGVLKKNTAPFDVLFSSSGMLGPLYKKLQAALKRPLLVSHFHGLSFFDHQATMDEVERGQMTVSAVYRYYTGALPPRWDMEGARYADLIIVQNGRDQEFLEGKGFQRVQRIPLPVHPEILAAGANAPKQAERDAMRLLWFGSWIARKGIHYLPQAFEKISERFPEARLTIGGTGAAPEEITAHFHDSLRTNIQVLPKISLEQHIAELSRNAIFLFPSLSEGFGLAGLEALAMRMALVTTQTGFGGDLLADRQNARIVPAASAPHLAEAAIELMENPELRQQLAENGRRLAEQLTVERMIDEYEKVIEEALRSASR
jgi:glycosyltransferase involved in cell wall biosynthesis